MACMITIAIKLSPTELSNPDLDLRYQIPDRLAEVSDGSITDDGFDYLSDESMIIFLRASSEDSIANFDVSVCEREVFRQQHIGCNHYWCGHWLWLLSDTPSGL